MRVIFLEDVPNVAQAGEIKEIADGYGRNFLLPKKLAILAKAGATKVLEMQHQIKTRHQQQTEAELHELADQVDGKEINIKVRAGAKERLYGSITGADVASELEKAVGVVIDKKKVDLVEPIRQLGSYEVAIKLSKDVTPRVKINVIEEETD